MEIIRRPDKLELYQLSAKAIEKEIKSYKDNPVLFLLPGGSAFAILDYLSTKNFGPRMTIGQGDERFSTNPDDQNWRSFEKSDFWKKIKDRGTKAIQIDVLGSADEIEAAEKYEHDLKDWIQKNPQGKILGLFGIGADGHTSGIMPYPEDQNFFDRTFLESRLAVGYDASKKNPFEKRVTVTLSFIRSQMAFCAVFAIGTEKRAAIERIADETGSLAETPSRIFREVKSNIFTDVGENF